MRTPSKQSPTLTLLDRLEAKYLVREDVFDVHLPEGEVMQFRHIKTMTDRKGLQTHVKSFADRVESGKGLHSSWKEYLPIDRDVAESLATISYLSVSPKLSDLDTLRLHRLPGILDLISFQIHIAINRVTDLADVEEIESEKKDSETTNSQGSDSASA